MGSLLVHSWYLIVLDGTSLHCIKLHCPPLNYTTLHFCTELHYTAVFYYTLNSAASRSTVLHHGLQVYLGLGAEHWSETCWAAESCTTIQCTVAVNWTVLNNTVQYNALHWNSVRFTCNMAISSSRSHAMKTDFTPKESRGEARGGVHLWQLTDNIPN